MRKLLGRKAPARVEERTSFPAQEPAAQADPSRPIYPTYGEVYARESRRDRELRNASAPFRLAPRRDRIGTDERLSATTEPKRTPFKSEVPLRRANTWSRAYQQPKWSDDDTSPYSLSHPPENKFHYHEHSNAKDYASGLFKWKRASGIAEVTRRMGKERVEDEPPDPRVVDAHISRCLTDAANFCRAPSHPDDWRQVHALGHSIQASETNSKEAVRTLRHELRSREAYVQRRAVRAWGIWSLSSGGNFGTYAANTQLLGILEDMLSNSSTQRELSEYVKKKLTQSKTSQRFRPVARLWARVRPDHTPPGGEPLRHALFGGSPDLMPAEARYVSMRLPQEEPREMGLPSTFEQLPEQPSNVHQTIQELPASLEVRRTPLPDAQRPSPRPECGISPLERQLAGMSFTPVQGKPPTDNDRRPVADPAPRGATAPILPERSPCLEDPVNAPLIQPQPLSEPEDPAEHVAAIYHECQVVLGNASVLSEALSFQGLASPLAEEFIYKVQASQSYLFSELSWVTEHTERQQQDHEAATRAEALLADVLEALSNAGEALSLCDRLANPRPTELVQEDEDESDEIPYDTKRPSEKALGKRRAIEQDVQEDEGLAGAALQTPFPPLTESDAAHPPLCAPSLGKRRVPKPPLPAVPPTSEPLHKLADAPRV